MELVIGTKRWSSWSMRPWLALKHAGVAFDERLIPLREHGTTGTIAEHSPNGKVPALKDGDLVVWDSLAICEYLAERYPEAHLWPQDAVARALARSACAEMHSGFASLRGEAAMELTKTPHEVTLSEATHDDIRRIVALWADLRGRFKEQGEFLVGPWSIADAFFTPVATRFLTYGVQLAGFGDHGVAAMYADSLLKTPEYLAWLKGAQEEA
nr:glutathione S-transferase family protein [Caulobacter sp. S45]